MESQFRAGQVQPSMPKRRKTCGPFHHRPVLTSGTLQLWDLHDELILNQIIIVRETAERDYYEATSGVHGGEPGQQQEPRECRCGRSHSHGDLIAQLYREEAFNACGKKGNPITMCRTQGRSRASGCVH